MDYVGSRFWTPVCGCLLTTDLWGFTVGGVVGNR